MNVDQIQPGKTYAGPPWPRDPHAYRPERTVLEIGPGFSTYGQSCDGTTFGEIVRYRVTHAPGNTERLRGREYTCRLSTFAAWARVEIVTKRVRS